MLIGKRISKRYKILEVIGGGGMSNVYLAHDMILNRDVAIKILHYNFNNEEEAHRRFQREALSATSLNHPNIVSIYDVGEDEGMHYLVMEYVKGMTLKQYITEFAPLAPKKCVEIMKQLTSAIATAHENQIIHRDIKPQNILMDEEGNVKVTDFGIAMALTATSFTKTNSVLGTVHYLSPEQARGGMTTKKSDIYSLGIVLYELLTGELPFSGESAVSIALKHLQAETPSVRAIVPTIPQSLENVVLRATSKDARHRYHTVEKMYEDLETVLSDDRAYEAKFVIPEDHDATKAMPVIKSTSIPDEDDQDKTMVIKPKNETKSNTKQKKKKKRKVLWTILSILMILLIAGVVLFLNPEIISGKKIKVPDVANTTLDEAINQLQTAGFTIGTQKIRHSDDIKEGIVIGTNPAAGTERLKETPIDLIVSSGKETSKMDDYVGKDIDKAKNLLNKRGFKKITVKKVYSDKTIDSIVKQTPASGKEIVPSETNVVLNVSQGERQNILSNLIGFDENALKTYANSSGFNIKIVDEEYSDEISAGKVVSQSVEAGTTLKVGSMINVVLSKGPQKKEVRTVTKTLQLDFNLTEEELAEKNYQTVKIFIQDKSHAIEEIHQEFRIYSDTKKPINLVIEEDTEAAFKVLIDDEVIYNEKISFNDL
ncbi:MAG: Stk1 family PASTA domain-containing Ser/Thr kinase [Kurthia sp.]|nr:Stk1 family PASTA domain-containing Ser/Thr kinase [Candidatus Kurthia equi]